MSQSPSPTQRNHTARIGRLITAVDSVRQRYSDLSEVMRQILRTPELNPLTRVHQLIAEYELETGEKIHPLLDRAITHLGDSYNGISDLIDQHAPPVEAIEVIIEERTWWNVSHKRNEYMAAAQRRRRAGLAGRSEVSQDDIDAANADRGIPPANPQPWTDEELRSSDVWRRARQREDERADAAPAPAPEPESRAQYESDRAERQAKDEVTRAQRKGGPLRGKNR